MRHLAEVVACHFGRPVAWVVFLAFCLAWILAGGSVDFLTMILSVLAITATQMVLAGQQRDTLALKLQIAELVRALPGARDEVADADRLSEDEIKKLRERRE